MAKYIVGRIGQSFVVLLLLSAIIFFVLNLSGDPVRLLLPPDAPAQEVELMRDQLGLNDPLWVQYGRFLTRAVHIDFGDSIKTGESALALVSERLLPTLSLGMISLALATLIAQFLGIVSALRRGRAADQISLMISLLGQSLPIFWLALMMILIFSVTLRWFPATGFGSWVHFILPVGTLTIYLLGGITRVTRASFLEVWTQPYIRTARAKGVKGYQVVLRHGLRNAAVPIITQVALQLRFVIGGSVITESIFGWPGLGRLLVDSVFARDYPLVQAGVFVIALVLIGANLLVDVLYGWLNPRVRLN